MRTGSIYALTTPQGTPFYVGRTLQSPGNRVGDHLRRARAGHPAELYRLLRQTGRVGLWILEQGVPIGELIARETHWQLQMESQGFRLFNSASGGCGCVVQRESVREQIRAYASSRDRGPGGRFLPVPADA